MDIVDLVNDFINTRKTEKSPENINSNNLNSENIGEDIETQRANNIEPINNKNGNLEYYVELLNQGVDPSKIEKHFNLAYGKLEELLLSNNYKFYSFMNFWTTLDEEQLCHDLVSHLNKGNTIYDLSGKYLRGNKERLRFVSMVEKLLDKYQYEYNFSLKNWEIKASSNKKGIILIVEALNTGKPLKEVAEKFEVTPASLRLSLKNANYRYDPLFQVWTTKERKELVDQLSLDIRNGLITIEELRKKGFDSKTLGTLKYLSDHKQNTVLETKTDSIDEKVSSNLNKDNTNTFEYNQLPKQDANTLEPDHLKAETALGVTDLEKKEIIKTQKDTDLSVEDIKILKEIIGFWTLESDSGLKQINIFIDSPILKKLEIYSEKVGLSKSKVIANALLDFLKD